MHLFLSEELMKLPTNRTETLLSFDV